jgi:hypothetical protein
LTARKHKPSKNDDVDAVNEQGCGRDDGGGRKATTRRINTTTSAPNLASRNVGEQYCGGAINDGIKPLTSTTTAAAAAAAASAKTTSIRSRSKHVGIHKEESPDMKGGDTTTIVPRRMSREVDALLASSMTSGPPLSRKLFLDDTTTTTGARKGVEQHTVVALAAGHRGRYSTRGDGRVVLGDRSNNTTTKNNTNISTRIMGDSKRELNSFTVYYADFKIVRHFINIYTSFS